MRVDLIEGDEWPKSWIGWGRIKPYARDWPILSYFFLMLPFYKYGHSFIDERPTWFQLCLRHLDMVDWQNNVPSFGWKFIWREIDRAS